MLQDFGSTKMLLSDPGRPPLIQRTEQIILQCQKGGSRVCYSIREYCSTFLENPVAYPYLYVESGMDGQDRLAAFLCCQNPAASPLDSSIPSVQYCEWSVCISSASILGHRPITAREALQSTEGSHLLRHLILPHEREREGSKSNHLPSASM